MARTLKYRILIIDDDERMNSTLRELLSGHKVVVGDITVQPALEFVDVVVQEDPDRPGYWHFASSTIERLRRLSQERRFDLVMVDFGYAAEAVKAILWAHSDEPLPKRKEEAKGRLLTVRDLSEQFESRLKLEGMTPSSSNSVFRAARRVVLRSMGSKKALGILGPVIPNRLNETQAAFPHAEVNPIDPRTEFYRGDEFYEFYEFRKEDASPEFGREFYRQLAGSFSVRVVEGEILRYLLAQAGRPRIRRSVLNVALFGGMVALLGGTTQRLTSVGWGLVERGNAAGWWLFGSAFLVLAIGSVLLSAYFQSFSRAVVRWVGPEEESRDSM